MLNLKHPNLMSAIAFKIDNDKTSYIQMKQEE